MRHDHHGHALGGEILHHVQHLAHHFGVQGAGGFVKEHHVGVHAKGAHNGDALLLSAGKLLGIYARLLQQTHARQQLGGLFGRRFFGHLAGLNGSQRKVLHHGQMRKQVELLKHHAHAAADQVDVAFGVGDVGAFKEYLPFGGPLKQIQAAQKGALARTAGADDHDFFAGSNMLVDALEDLELPKGFFESLNGYHPDAASFPACPPYE